MIRFVRLGVLICMLGLVWSWSGNVSLAQERFYTNFEQGLEGWRLTGAHAISIVEAEDAAHGNVMHVSPDNFVFALIEGSDAWGPVRIEADVRFVDDTHNYLGVIYNYTEGDGRFDFGSIYIKGNGSYLRMNPFRDGNVGWGLYEEYRTPLEGDDAIVIGAWTKVKAEIKGDLCHFYVGDMETPKVTFPHSLTTQGLVGFNPRIVGGPVQIDNVRVTSIEALAYQDSPRPARTYQPEALHTDWEVIGPLAAPSLAVERSQAEDASVRIDGLPYPWRSAPVDMRGAVITGLAEYTGPREVAYLRTVLRSEREQDVTLHLSSIDELAWWVNGQFEGYSYPGSFAWYDFTSNPDHAGDAIQLQLKPGANHVLVRVRNGRFAQGGFFAQLEGLDP